MKRHVLKRYMGTSHSQVSYRAVHRVTGNVKTGTLVCQTRYLDCWAQVLDRRFPDWQHALLGDATPFHFPISASAEHSKPESGGADAPAAQQKEK